MASSTSPATQKERHTQLKSIEAEYVSFAAYLQTDTEQENWDVNGVMLKSLLGALYPTGVSKKRKRIILTCGVKDHLDAPKSPCQNLTPGSKAPRRLPLPSKSSITTTNAF